ncbi:MAG: serine/threonine protein kinase [Methanomicrobiaceae archaeon]|nr:serine/threonine protein kinase [Methanomicrobiaceae archaeon]
MSFKRIICLIFIGLAFLSAIAVPVYAENKANQSITFGISFENSDDLVYLNISGEDKSNLTTKSEYSNYMQSFSSNIILLFILCISGVFLLLLNTLGKKYSGRFFYQEKFLLRVFLIPTYSVMGILLVLITLFTIAIVGNSVEPSSDNIFKFLMSLVFFTYAITSLWLAYSIVLKKVYIFILTFEAVAPFILLIFSITDPQSYESALDILLSILLILMLAAIPLIHTRMIKKRKSFTPGKNEHINNSDAGANTLILNEEQEAIILQTKKTRLLPSDLSERYMDAEYIGKGGTAKIFRAKKRENGETVAVKVPISFDERTGRNFLREMNIWKELSHKNIVKVYSINILPVPYVEMEYFKTSLADLKKPVSGALSLSIITGIAEGLLYAHNKGVLHRDIKPQNILLSEDYTPMITDWGLGKKIGEVNETKTIAFSLNYASPEQVAPGIFGHSDERTDIFQLGVVFYELLTGLLPFSGEGIGEFSGAIINDNPKLPSSIISGAKKFDKIVMKCLQKHPEDRYQSIEEFLNDLKRLSDSSVNL